MGHIQDITDGDGRCKIDSSLAQIFKDCVKSDAELEKEVLEALVRQSISTYKREKNSSPEFLRDGSRHGVQHILDRDIEVLSAKLISNVCSPYFKGSTLCTYTRLKDIPAALHYLHRDEVLDIERQIKEHVASRLSAPGQIADYLSYSDYEVRALAKELAGEWGSSAQERVADSERLLGFQIRGDTFESRYARTCDPKFWRRTLTVCIARAREHFFLRMSLISSKREAYASNHSVDMREAQMKRQHAWMKSTIVVPVHETACMRNERKSDKELSLADIAISPTERFAKLYTFIHAIDQLGVEAKLSSAMITITLEPEWHPNPSHGTNRWNGRSPRDAHQSFSKRWQSILRDLHRIGIRLSGFRVTEPHKDGCPHYHIWTLYRLEDELKILSTIMKYFPAKLKVRMPYRKGENKSYLDKIFESRNELLAGCCRNVVTAKEGAQVELSRIDRTISTGASYALKYVLKSVNMEKEYSGQAEGKNELGDSNLHKTEKEVKTAQRVEAYRTVWGINQGQLFGISKCLTIWDELRRMAERPKNAVLRRLWSLARGSDKCGKVQAGSMQRGDARAFLVTLGGLDANKTKKDATKKRFVLGRLVESARNRYGDLIKKTVGVVLLSKQRVKVRISRSDTPTKKGVAAIVMRTETLLVASIKTRTIAWKFARKEVFARPKKAPIIEQRKGAPSP